MVLPFRMRSVFCALSVCVLSACGGGGDDINATAQNVLKPSAVEVLSGDGNIAPGKYVVDTVFVGASGTGLLGEEKVEWLDISIAGSTTKGQLIYSDGNTGRYAIMLVDEASPGDVYACRGNVAWSAAQLAYLTANTALEDLPVCTGAVQIIRSKDFRQFLALGSTIPNLAHSGRFLSVNTDLNWSPQPNDINFVVPAPVDEVEAPAT